MEDLKTLETKLNALIAKGEMIEATEQYYGPVERGAPPPLAKRQGDFRTLLHRRTKLNPISLAAALAPQFSRHR